LKDFRKGLTRHPVCRCKGSTGCNVPGFDAARRSQLLSAMGLADRPDIRNDARSETDSGAALA
jgi:hypothetical protein